MVETRNRSLRKRKLSHKKPSQQQKVFYYIIVILLHDIPALLSIMSSFPLLATTVSTALATCSSTVTSHFMNCPAEPSSLATIWPASSSISTILTRAPWLTNSSAVAFPSPLAPPVMTATFPSNFLYIMHEAKKLEVLRVLIIEIKRSNLVKIFKEHFYIESTTLKKLNRGQ